MPDSEIEKQPKSPEDILRKVASDVKFFDTTWEQALLIKNITAANQAYLTKGKLVVSLPQRIRVALERGFAFPEEELEILDEFSQRAQKYLDDNNYFGISTIFIPKGSKESDLNYLERLIERLYGKKSPQLLDFITPNTTEGELKQIISKFLSLEDEKALGGKEEAVQKVADGFAYLGPFAPVTPKEPETTFDLMAFKIVSGLSKPEAIKVLDLLKKMGVVQDVGQTGRFSISEEVEQAARQFLT